MNTELLKEKIDALDPVTHKALRDSLMTEYQRLTKQKPSDDIVEVIDTNIFSNLFEEAVEKISRQYLPGTIKYVEKNHPDVYTEMVNTDNTINELWKLGLERKISVKKFQDVLNQWVTVNMNAIQIFRKAEKP